MSFNFKLLKENEKLGGACIKGGFHRKDKIPNQDAYITCRTIKGLVFAVADGVGSHKYSQIGSKSAVNAVVQSFEMFEKGIIQVSEITKTIFSEYRKGVPENKRTMASTTCIFAYLSDAGELFLGQSGDGVCYFKINDTFLQLQKKDDDFANIVSALNASRESAKWVTRHFTLSVDDKVSILMATDGISNDIIPGHERDCLEYYREIIQTRFRMIANYRLYKELKSWDCPGSGDDKTLIVYKRG